MVITSILRYLLFFAGLLLLQVVVIDPIDLGRFITPILYVLLVMVLPANIKPWALLIISFVAGIIADTFSDTGGMHAFSLVCAAYVRNYLLPVFLSKDDAEKPLEPTLFSLGYRMFFFYAASLTFVYHLVFTFLDEATLSNFFSSMGTVLVSTLVAVILIFLLQLLLYRTKPQEA